MNGTSTIAPTTTKSARRTRVAYITQWFPPEPVEIALWIPQALRRQGLSVGVLTGIPNFPSGRVHDGYRAWRGGRDGVDGFPVVRAALYPSHDRSSVGRIANYLSFAASSSVGGHRLLHSADVALVYGSPITAAAAALANRVPYVLLVQDVWPDSVFATGFLSEGMTRMAAETLLNPFILTTYRRAAHIAVISPGMRDLLIDRGVPPEKVSVVYNWVDETVLRPMPPDVTLRAELGIAPDDFVLLYAGNHGAAQSLDIAIRAMAELRDLQRLHLLLIGDGVDKERLRRLATELSVENVHFRPPVPASLIPSQIAAADLMLVSLADEPLFHITLPSKVQGILACGAPVLACAPGDAARLVREARAGLIAQPGDPASLAAVIRHACSMPTDNLRAMGRAGLDFYRSRLSERTGASALAQLVTSAATKRRASAL